MKKNFWYYCYFLIIIFVFFDGIRSNSIFADYLTLVRESLVWILMIKCYFIQKNSFRKIYGKCLILFFIYHIFISILSYLQPGLIRTSFIVKPFTMLLGIYVFYYYPEVTKHSYDTLFKLIVKTGVVFVFVNTILYFVPASFILDQNPWWGRISVGYPTMDVISLAYALSIILFYPYLQVPKLIKSVFIIILIIGNLLNFSGTGIILLAIILLTTFLAVGSLGKNIRPIIIAAVISAISFSAIITFVSSNYSKEYTDGVNLLQNKIDIILGKNVQYNTLETRYEQYDKISEKMTTTEKIFGRTLINASNDMEDIKHGAYMIENQYDFILACYGYIGLGIYVMVIFSFIMEIFRLKINTSLKVLLLLSSIIFITNSRTLIVLVLYPNYMMIALFMAYTRKLRNAQKKLKLQQYAISH